MATSTTTKTSHASQPPERFCKYIHRYCNQTRLEGFDYCIRHILEDKAAPFRQCMFVNPPNKKRCTNAAPKADKNDRRDNVLCPFHAKRAMMKPRIQHAKKRPVPEGPAALLKSLEHYCTDPVHEPSYVHNPSHNDRTVVVVREDAKPSSIEQLEEAIVKDGEPLLDRTYIEPIDDDFCHNDSTGFLDHAGVYTHKEVCMIAKEKIQRLQQLYCMELNYVCQQMKEERRKFLRAIRNRDTAEEPPKLVYRDLKDVRGRLVAKIEKPTPPPENDSSLLAKIDKKLLLSLKRYHRRSGVEKIFRKRFLDQQNGVAKPVKPVCCFEKNGLKCIEEALVAANYCKNHILTDPNQVLFVPCGRVGNCTRPVLAIGENPACDLHFSVLSSTESSADFVVESPANESTAETTAATRSQESFSANHPGTATNTYASMTLEPGATATPTMENTPVAMETDQMAMESDLENAAMAIAAETVSEATASDILLDADHFQSMDDIASLGLDAISPEMLFSLDQFGEPGDADTVLSEDLMQIQTIPLNPPQNILSENIQNLTES